MPKLVIVLLITLFLNYDIHASPVHSQELRDNETEESSEVSLTANDESDETGSAEYPPGLVEEIKSRILKSLHKTKAPKNHVPLPDLQRLNFRNMIEENHNSSENNNSTSGKTKTDFLPAYVGKFL